MREGMFRMFSMALGVMAMRGGWGKQVKPENFEQLTSANCGSATNGGRKHSVAKAKREAQKARNRSAQRRYR
jgi:hypothetical protein